MRRELLVPVVAGGLAAAYLAAVMLAPGLLLGGTPLAVLACCGLALRRRGGRWLMVGQAAIFAFLVAGFTGAAALVDAPGGGLAWLLLVVFLLPLPVVPWLYWRTSGGPSVGDDSSGGGELPSTRVPDPRSLTPGEGGGD